MQIATNYSCCDRDIIILGLYGRANLRAKKYREALQDLTNSINLDPENDQKVQQRAKLYRMMGRCSDAMSDLAALQAKSKEPVEVSTPQQSQ